MNGSCVISLNYKFDYGRFDKLELKNRAKNTLGELFGFVRSTFDGLIEIGRVLQDFYYDCLAFCANGKQVFEEWLKSDDFGASRYIAKSAMAIYLWFDQLPLKVKHLVRQNVQKWSVSALRQLTKVSNDLVKELVSSGKKTALEMKQVIEEGNGREGQGGKNIEVINSDSYASENTNYIPPLPHSFTPPLLKPELAPGMRIIVTGDDYGWNGHRGIIICQDGDSWWVLLDHVVAQGLTTKKLYKPNQLEIEGIVENPDTKDVFTAIQVDQKIKEVLAQKDEQQGLSAQSTNIEIEASLEKIQREKEELVKQLQAQESKLANFHALTVKNQQLEQRTAELEKKLENINQPLRQIKLAYEAEKAAKSDLRKSITSLQAKVQQLNNALLIKDKDIARLQVINAKQQQEIQRLSAVEVSLQQMRDREEKVVSRFGELGQHSGWKGWSSNGYKAVDGSLYTRINAIEAFINDLNQQS